MIEKEVTENLLGYRVYAGTIEDCCTEICESLTVDGDVKWLACINPHSFCVALEKPSFSYALCQANWLVPDGIGIVLASKTLGGRIKERVTGSDVFEAVSRQLNCQASTARVFFLGSSDSTLEAIVARMKRDFPKVVVAGWYSPPYKGEFSDAEIDEMINRVNSSSANVLWVGLSAPKQEELIVRISGRVNVQFAGAIGAVFDFYAGTVRRSHRVFRKYGLEWLPRLVREPNRLWRRTFFSGPLFAWCVLAAKFNRVKYFVDRN